MGSVRGPSTDRVDLYIILGLERGATLSEIKRAYRRLARRFHPDINPGDRPGEAFFRQVIEAYDTLRDPAQRREYDLHGARATMEEPASVEFQGFDFSAGAEGPQASTFGDLFADVFQSSGSRGSSDRPEPGVDLHVDADLSFDEVLHGVRRQMIVTRLAACPACRGAGVRRGVEDRCAQCRGAGTLRWARGHMMFSKACAHCGGSGRQPHQACTTCGAEGVVPRTERIAVEIPPGVSDGTLIRIPGKGNAGRRGGTPGDLYLGMRISEHPVFRRDGSDLHVVVPVAIHEAALGARIDVPTPEGPRKLRVPPRTQSGQRFRLRGSGVPTPRNGERGDLVVEIRLVLPPVVDERSKALLREFGRIHPEDVRKDLGA